MGRISIYKDRKLIQACAYGRRPAVSRGQSYEAGDQYDGLLSYDA